MENITYNQAMIAQLCQATPLIVSRLIVSQNIQPIHNDNNYTKRYPFSVTREITDLVYASHKRPIFQKIHVFYNFKGGTGKTSMCYQVATHLSLLGFKVLCIDLDPQGHLSNVMNVPEDWSGPTIYDIMINGVSVDDAIVKVMPGLDLIPSNISVTRIEVPLSSKNKREEKLKLILDPLCEDYDFIIMDCNPTISTLNLNALVACDRLNIVCETQPFSLNGLGVFINEMNNFYHDMGLNPNYCIIPNKYEIKTAIAQEVLGALRVNYGNHVMGSVVRKSEDINIAAKMRLPISAFCKSRSAAFEDVMDLVHELVQQSSKNSNVKVAA
ncbi:MAG: ParA family protein [Alphaproteobacteria bacterium]|jgi:chromosome partitioning protein|nr:ParA family protein [Alphaproteobacteria bacterium]